MGTGSLANPALLSVMRRRLEDLARVDLELLRDDAIEGDEHFLPGELSPSR